MIVVTGAGGFIGSNLVHELNNQGHYNIIAVDDFKQSQKCKILDGLECIMIDRNIFIEFLKTNVKAIDIVYHLGARTDTTETDVEIFNKLNLNYSKAIWNICTEYKIPLIYASSAATYGNGEFGYNDNTNSLNYPLLKPLNAYGDSKQDFDIWVLQRDETPPFFIGLKFFNVYGYGEYNKGRMASVVYHGINQFNQTGKIKLFKSHNSDYEDGEQMRDFISVDDVVRVCYEFMNKGHSNSGIYNLGTGKARKFLDLAKGIFNGIGVKPIIEFIDIPLDIRGKYQYYTQATTKKLKRAGINTDFIELEDGIKKYYKQMM